MYELSIRATNEPEKAFLQRPRPRSLIMGPEKMPTPEVGSENDISKPEETHIEELRREQTHVDIDPAVHRKLNRKFDLHVIPFLFGIWYDTYTT